MAQWTKTGTRGIRYREHESRRHGVRKDRYYAIRYQVAGKRREEGLGWSSEGWTEKKAAAVLAELLENHRRGEGPASLHEKREVAEATRRQREETEEQIKRDQVTFGEVFHHHFLPAMQINRRRPGSIKRDESLFRLWIGPVIGDKPMINIVAFDCDRLKRTMAQKGKSPRSVQYALAVVRQVFNFAIDHDLFVGKNPAAGKKVKVQKFDNRRLRFLNREEAADLLAELKRRGGDVHDMALLALNTGMRAGEIFALTWADIDLTGGTISIRDPKGAVNRYAYTNQETGKMFRARVAGRADDIVFRGRFGDRIKQAPVTFMKAVDALGLNDGITDRRQKVTFHTLRHTFASWLVESRTDIYLVQKLLGHSDIRLTERYSHVGADQLRDAVAGLV